jgi:amidohydrolase
MSTNDKSNKSDLNLNIDWELAKRQDDLIRMRRDFHSHPELSFGEGRTAQIVADRLEKIGFQVSRQVGKTGVVAVLEGGLPGKTVMWRADMDALPLQEDKTIFDFHSETDGVMHACGHDGHTAIALTVADILASRKNDLSGRAVFVFQPAEETGEGAIAMLQDGIFSENGPIGGLPDYTLGLHLGAFSPTGYVTVKPGPVMAAADSFKFTVKGIGGHASMPHLTVDPILVGSQLVVALQTLISREIAPMNPAVLSFGTFQAGTKNNIIPVEAHLSGSLRTLDPQLRRYILKRMEEMARDLGNLYRAQITFTLGMNAPAVINDIELTRFARQSVADTIGDSFVLDNPAIMGSEDMSQFMEQVPGCFMFVGAQREGEPETPHHSPLFAIDEKSLDIGVKIATRTIVDFLTK